MTICLNHTPDFPIQDNFIMQHSKSSFVVHEICMRKLTSISGCTCIARL